jgi:hypothetical protein
MPISLRNLEWLNHNSQRAYPLTADSTKLDTTEAFELPDDFIVGLILPVHWGIDIDTTKFFISKIAAYATGFSVTVGYDSLSGVIDVATALVARASHTTNQVYNLGGMGDFADSRGQIVIGKFAGIDEQPAGLFTFDYEATRLEVDAVRPHIRGVMSVQVQNGSELSRLLTGRIRLVAGRNTRIRVESTIDDDPLIILDAIEGEGLTDSCVCSPELDPIRTINGIPPDQNGNFQFLGNECLEVVEGDHILEFKDVCSQPCCGCEELETVTSALEAFGDKATTLENFLVNLEQRVTQMDAVVLGSRLGDRGCNAEC